MASIGLRSLGVLTGILSVWPLTYEDLIIRLAPLVQLLVAIALKLLERKEEEGGSSGDIDNQQARSSYEQGWSSKKGNLSSLKRFQACSKLCQVRGSSLGSKSVSTHGKRDCR